MSALHVVLLVQLLQVSVSTFSAAEKLSSPHCADFGVSVHDEHSWRAVANTALQCQKSCATSLDQQGDLATPGLFSALGEGQKCGNFTFYPKSKLCYLSPPGLQARKQEDAISGPQDCPPEVGSKLANGTKSLLFIPYAAHFNGQGALFEAAVQASQFAARRVAEEAKDVTLFELMKHLGRGGGGQDMFINMDLNSSGAVELDEFVAALSKLQLQLGVTPSSIFRKVDLNKDSKIDLTEFQKAQKGPHKSSEEIVTLAAGAARGVAEKGGLLFVQQEICAAAAASATGMEEARLQGKDLEAQTIAAVDAVMVDLPKNQGVALQCLAASFSAGLGTAGAKSSIKAAETAAWKALIRSELNETQRQEAAAQVAGLAAGLHAQANHSHPYFIRKAIEGAVGLLPDTSTPKKELIDQIVGAMATGWKVEKAKQYITDPVAANLVWVGEAFYQAFQATKQKDLPTSAAQRAADFNSRGQFTSHLAELQKAAKAAQEKELRQGASVVEQAAAAAEAIKSHAEKLNKSSTEEDRLMLGAVAAAVRLGAPEAKSVELAGLVQKAAAKEGFSKLAQAEAGAWASATAGSAEATTGELSAKTAAAVQPEAKALRGVQTAAASVAIDGSWHSKNDLGNLMNSEESFEKEMSKRMGREDLVHQNAGVPDNDAGFWIPAWLPILGASLCCLGVVLGFLTWKQKTPKKSQRNASLEINYEEVQDALTCKDCEIASEMAPSPVAALGSPMSASPQASPTATSVLQSEAERSPPETHRSPELLTQRPGPLLISYPDWKETWQPGEQQEVNYQVPPGARPGSTLLVDVGNGLAVPTLVPESAYAGLTLTLRR